MRLLRRGVRTAGILSGVLAVLTALSLAALRFAGYAPEVVYSGSMRPALPVGALVLVKPVPRSEVAVGDVITFADPNDPARLITHRVVQRVRRPEGDVFRTKGDANSARDPWTIALPAQVAAVSFDVPVAGYALWYAKTREARTVGIAAIALSLLFSLLRAIWRPRPEGATA